MCAFIILHKRLELTRACSEALSSYLATNAVPKLQLGAGTNPLDEWFNTDVAPSTPGIHYLDSTQRFPFEDQTFRYIFSEHHIEHITYPEGLAMLRECYRALKPQGKLRIATPSLETLLHLYTTTRNDQQQRYIRFITDTFLQGRGYYYNPVFVINNAFRNWGHQFLYDQATLKNAMEEAGFVGITVERPGESADEHLRSIERHGHFIGHEDMNIFETMVLEGKRP